MPPRAHPRKPDRAHTDQVQPKDATKRDGGPAQTVSNGPAAPPAIRYMVSELLRGRREAVLEHDGAEYHLRVTSKGRLILTK